MAEYFSKTCGKLNEYSSEYRSVVALNWQKYSNNINYRNNMMQKY